MADNNEISRHSFLNSCVKNFGRRKSENQKKNPSLRMDLMAHVLEFRFPSPWFAGTRRFPLLFSVVATKIVEDHRVCRRRTRKNWMWIRNCGADSSMAIRKMAEGRYVCSSISNNSSRLLLPSRNSFRRRTPLLMMKCLIAR